MAFRQILVAVSVLAVFAVGAFVAFQVSDVAQNDAPATDRNVTNESLVQEYDSYQFVDNATNQYTAGFNDSVTVYNQSNHELVEGQDYEWNSTDGTILYLSSPNTTEGNTSTISYTYQYNTQDVRDVSRPLTAITESFGLVAFAAGALALVVLLLWFGSMIASRIGTSDVAKRTR